MADTETEGRRPKHREFQNHFYIDDSFNLHCIPFEVDKIIEQ
jgi:hypothetical protein